MPQVISVDAQNISADARDISADAQDISADALLMFQDISAHASKPPLCRLWKTMLLNPTPTPTPPTRLHPLQDVSAADLPGYPYCT